VPASDTPSTGNQFALRSPIFDVRTRADAQAFVITLYGELDLATSPQLVAAIEQAERSGKPEIVIDLGELSFVDSSGINAVVQLHRRSAKSRQRLRILPGNSLVQRVFTLTGLASELPFQT